MSFNLDKNNDIEVIEENLIFIVSQPRSGSTYLQNLLSNNIETNTCSESWLLLNFANQIKPDLIKAKFDYKLANTAFNEYLNKYPLNKFKDAQKKFLLNLYKPMFNGYGFVIDKTPRYWEILEEIIELFPKSKVIILKRNPLQVATSIIKTWNIKTLFHLSYYKRDLLHAPKVLHNFSTIHKSNPNVYSLKYESLIQNTKKEVKQVYQWIGINFTDSVLDINKNEKYKGKFGDPFQNSEQDYVSIKKNISNKELKSVFKKFLNGYGHYLGKDFLKEYGYFSFNEISLKKTKSFSYFIHLSRNRKNTYNFKNEFKYFLKEIYFRLFN